MVKTRRCSGKLYASLGLKDTATSSEIKKAYHKNALKYHPDKAGPGHEAEFKVVQNAYSVLSEPEKRDLYDKLGSKGMDTYGNVPGAAMVAVHPAVVILYPLLWLVFVTLLLAFTVMLIKKVDDGIPGTWGGAVFVPLWVLSAILGLVAIRILFLIPDVYKKKQTKEEGEEEENPKRRYQAVGFILLLNLIIALFIASLAQISQYLDGHVTDMARVFTPIFFLFTISVIGGVLQMDYTSFVKRVSLETGVDPDDVDHNEIKGQYIASCVAQLINLACQCAFVALVYINVAHPAPEGRSWFVVFVPLFIRLGLPILVGISMIVPAKTSDPKTKVFAIASMLVIGGLVILTVVLLAWKCEKGRQGLPHEGPTLGQVMILPLIAMSVSMLGSLFMSVAAIQHTCCGDGTFPGEDDYGDEEAEQHNGGETKMGYQEQSSCANNNSTSGADALDEDPLVTTATGSGGSGVKQETPGSPVSGYQHL